LSDVNEDEIEAEFEKVLRKRPHMSGEIVKTEMMKTKLHKSAPELFSVVEDHAKDQVEEIVDNETNAEEKTEDKQEEKTEDKQEEKTEDKQEEKQEEKQEGKQEEKQGRKTGRKRSSNCKTKENVINQENQKLSSHNTLLLRGGISIYRLQSNSY
jgi:beta-glucanase (GH16 family)